MSFMSELDDLKYFCSKDYASKGKKELQNAKFYRWCRRLWIFAIFNTIIAAPVVLIFFRQRLPLPIFVIYIIVSLVTLGVSFAVWGLVTKDKR